MVASMAAFAAFLAVGLVSSSPIKARTPYAVKETHYPPAQWQRVGPARSNHMVNLQIVLKQGQFDELERHLYEGMNTALENRGSKQLRLKIN